MSNKYTIGIDFGTLSARAVLVDINSGKVITDAVYEYPHGVMDTSLPSGLPLPADFALQHPRDYLEALGNTVSAVLEKVSPDDVIGIGIDFTTCTLIPVKADGTPLCFDPEFENDPHAYAKLWKHHAAQPEADRLNEAAEKFAPHILERLGGKTSSEWLFPKVMEVLDRSPKAYENTSYFIDGGDFIAWMLTGRQTRSYVFASYKALYMHDVGYPPKEMFKYLDPRLENVVEEKLTAPMVYTCEEAGYVDSLAKERFGVSPDAPFVKVGTTVACPEPDAHAAAPALGMSESGDMFSIFGTSSNYMLISDEYKIIPGICGVVKDGLIPGFNAYEAGLCCFGDHFAWVTKNICPPEYRKEAKARGLSDIQLISEKAAALAPGESGIIALNWWNGNRNILVDSSLSGMFLGMNLRTKPEDLFRAIVEANAFGTRVIIENFEKHGVKVDRMTAAGGIAIKSPFVMQTLADILGKTLCVSGYLHSSALGAAIYASVASKGHRSLKDACAAMADPCDTVYRPRTEAKAIYDQLYSEYLTLHDYFGRGGNDVMKRLKKISSQAKELKNERI